MSVDYVHIKPGIRHFGYCFYDNILKRLCGVYGVVCFRFDYNWLCNTFTFILNDKE